MRAREPDVQSYVVRDELKLGYEVFGSGDTTVLLMPTWTIIHSRFWKFQVPYLSRYYRVITYDGPGNGRTDRTTEPRHYAIDSYVADAVAVMDACEVDAAVVVGLSRGAAYTARLASLNPERVLGIVLVGAAIGLVEQSPERASIPERFWEPYPAEPEGWDKYNRGYWHDHYEDFVRFFMDQMFNERFSTKAYDDSVGWGLETTAAVLEAEARTPAVLAETKILDGVTCPILAIHGTKDQIMPHGASVEIARLTGGALHSMGGSGHNPLARDPVHCNLLLREFIEQVK